MLTVKFSQGPTFLWTNNSRSPDVHTLQINVNSLDFWVFPPSSLQAMFSTDLIESKQERVAINGVEPQMIGMLVSYAYTSEVYISKANVQVKYQPFCLLHWHPSSKESVLKNNICSRLCWQQPTCWT